MLLRFFEDETKRKEFRQAIWNLLRGHNIIQTDVEFPFIEENHDLFYEYLNLMGLDLTLHPMGGLYYLQKDGKQEETRLSAQMCLIFFIAVQKISDSLEDGNTITIFDLINKFEGYDLESLLLLGGLDPTQTNAFRDVNINTNEDLQKVLKTMTRVRFIEKLEDSKYRFRRSVVRLSDVATSLHSYEHIPIEGGEEE
jgi:hypothetical protein